MDQLLSSTSKVKHQSCFSHCPLQPTPQYVNYSPKFFHHYQKTPKMRSRGPSPLVPLLIVGVLGLVVFGPFMLSLAESVQTLIELLGGWDEDGINFIVLLLLVVLLLLIHFLAVFFPTLNLCGSQALRGDGSGYDGEGFGLGTLLFVVLFFILYNFL